MNEGGGGGRLNRTSRPRARPRYPGVEDLFRRATLLRETRPYPSLLRHCLSQVASTSASEHRTKMRTTVPAVCRRGGWGEGERRSGGGGRREERGDSGARGRSEGEAGSGRATSGIGRTRRAIDVLRHIAYTLRTSQAVSLACSLTTFIRDRMHGGH